MQPKIQQPTMVVCCTPSMIAAGGGYLDIVCFLVEKEAAIDEASNLGDTSPSLRSSCSQRPAKQGHNEIVCFQIESGAVSDSALEFVLQQGYDEVV